ncbi:MAG: putative DNA-binding domain-containing protein [Gammaproteobacteria bacterium]|nr:putative DNA-binding domain-containing protein [Gammaproteobacteria bacterium]
MSSEPEHVRLQRAFARHLRDPAVAPAPGQHEERRLAIYRHAVYANVAGLMQDNYPRLRAVMDDEAWAAMMRHYIVHHVAQASAFVDVPAEFLAYLEHGREADDDPPFLLELAHFDWLETLVGADTRDLDLSGIDPAGDLLAAIPVANPTLRMVTYRFPVHAIGPDYRPDVPPAQSTHIAAFRDPDDLYGFLDVNEPTRRLLERIAGGTSCPGQHILEELARDLAYADVAGFVAAGSTILERMRARGAVLGVRREQAD